jgi:AraC family transcriptional regulator of adaptative response / DNA-3-methyladenine glycosylase II
MEHLGATPLAVAQTRRVHFARKLLEGTQLPIADVALSSGFASVRRFNAAFQKAFHLTPTEARRKARGRNVSDEGGSIELRLPYRPPYDWPALLAFATPGVEAVGGESYRRTISIDGIAGTIAVRPSATRHEMLLGIHLAEPKHLIQIAEGVRRLLDLEADPIDICAHLDREASSPVAPGHLGLRVPGAWDGFELAVRAVLGQQVSVKGATTLAGRLAAACGEQMTESQQNGLRLLFPTAERLARTDLTKVGLPRARAAALQALAVETAAGRIRFDSSCDPSETSERLCRLPGIGAWTAQYIAMRALRDPDAFPASDLILRRAASPGARVISAKELEARAEAWRPWRAYAALHLWTGYYASASAARKPVPQPALQSAARKKRAYAGV